MSARDELGAAVLAAKRAEGLGPMMDSLTRIVDALNAVVLEQDAEIARLGRELELVKADRDQHAENERRLSRGPPGP